MLARDLTVYCLIMTGAAVCYGFAWFMREIVFDDLLIPALASVLS